MAKVLFVDDEKLILNSLKRGLRGQEFSSYYASSGMEALKILENVDIDVILSDMQMPQMNGLELLKAVEEKHPDVVKVILSGYAQLPQLIATINQASIFKYIAKPWDLYKELIPNIHEAIEFSLFKKEQRQKHERLEIKNKTYTKIFKTYNSKSETKDQSWDIIRIYHQVFMNVLKDQMTDISMLSTEHLPLMEYYKRFTDNLLSEIKKSEIYFEPRRIINEVVFALKKDDYKVQVEIGVDENSKNLYEGRGMHIKPIIISLIQDFVKKETVGKVKIISKEISRQEDAASMVYIIEGSKRTFSNYNTEGYNIKLYESLINIFGGELEKKEVNGQIALFIKVRLHITQDEEDVDEYTNS